MGEIKSTLDLVLEKTRHLTLSTVEKEDMELKETLKKVSGYLSRYRDGLLSVEALVREMENLAPAIRVPVRHEMARQMTLALDLSPGTDSLVTALETLAEPGWTEVLREVKRCRTEVREDLEVTRRRIEERMLAELAAAGIRGSAVVVKSEGDQEWLALSEELKSPCEERLEALRQALAA